MRGYVGKDKKEHGINGSLIVNGKALFMPDTFWQLWDIIDHSP